jgi:D-tagatose-1,6-bisphosphate aldolase subunit GatZ/KbaZ
MKNDPIRHILARHKRGEPLGIYSVCSAHHQVLQAAMSQAKTDGSYLLVESTSNQVDQFGGYSGMTPHQFVAYVLAKGSCCYCHGEGR